MLRCDHSNQRFLAIVSCVVVVVVVVYAVYMVVLTFEFVTILLKCDHSNESRLLSSA